MTHLRKVRTVGAEMRTGERSDARDNRLRILAAARRTVASAGPQVSVREMARRAGVSVATVYRHFPSKDDLLAEAFAEQFATCHQIVENGLAAADPWEGLRLVIQDLMVLHAHHQDFARTFGAPSIPSAELSDERDETLLGLSVLMQTAKEEGALRRDVTLTDLSMVLMANNGITASSTAAKVAAARRFAAFVTQSFAAGPHAEPLPPTPRLTLRAAS
ncbi:transcriptional regulator, TetR family [Actinacidiphila alni]|uniref:Transcriptional regulator, TetR family n=1 Tax=Actinacidiphila alni TaxID=380248 RepID=A0A1I2MZQ6_9ACTN|nr:TetR/AcrR family transcriptional regulator [Actinacidiphila alni]SFF94796.1 transcriptional regulator, TetR family [Actinacidiphila alni]